MNEVEKRIIKDPIFQKLWLLIGADQIYFWMPSCVKTIVLIRDKTFVLISTRNKPYIVNMYDFTID